jgi:hypothetical protein
MAEVNEPAENKEKTPTTTQDTNKFPQSLKAIFTKVAQEEIAGSEAHWEKHPAILAKTVEEAEQRAQTPKTRSERESKKGEERAARIKPQRNEFSALPDSPHARVTDMTKKRETERKKGSPDAVDQELKTNVWFTL